ncbi:hypothetical protein CTAYLR_000361 [Chrysophaeum taylorii]|uniref:DUF202 domain-containing protein n=1 Tax=Chrysophaeum taylorii TaxID=2483200 RepID=A0AAD7UG75_9STRA|nr:hypothetical protein CTAYLR_000361 [Chrysophaeum taylorii]
MTPTTILVRRYDESYGFEKVRWWGAISAPAVRRTVRGALRVDDEENEIELVDEESGKLVSFEALAEIRDGAMVTARRVPWWRRAAATPLDEHGGDLTDPEFQRAVLKYERVLSHLASERTLLAWLRAALTMLAQGISIWRIKGTSHFLGATAFVYLVLVSVTVAASIERWKRAKRILMLKHVNLFDETAVRLQAALVFFVILTAALTFFAIGADDTVFADFKPSNLFD